jgi:hypothetical protein
MKCITYVSQAVSSQHNSVVPAGLARIYAHSRKINAVLGISSILTHCNGYYLHIIEGEDDNVNTLLERIKKSSLHKNITIIFDTTIKKRYFPSLPIRLTPDIYRDPEFIRFLSDFQVHLKQLEPAPLSVFNTFLIDNSNSDTSRKASYIGLVKWPDFSEIKPTPMALDLCAKLVGKSVKYQDIFHSELSSQDIQQYKSLIRYFEKSGILTTEESMDSGKPTNKPMKISRFYTKMKSYLSRETSS